MTRLAWQVVECWQARTEMGIVELWLLRVVDGQHSQAWRVEWVQQCNGHRKGVVCGDESRARDELERRKARYPRVWRPAG